MKNKIPKITDGELKILEVLWEKSPLSASEIVAYLKEKSEWNRNTTYTFINRLVNKKIISRKEPGFICTPLFTEDEIKVSETKTFLDKMYDGSLKILVTSFINSKDLTDSEIEELKNLMNKSR